MDLMKKTSMATGSLSITKQRALIEDNILELLRTHSASDSFKKSFKKVFGCLKKNKQLECNLNENVTFNLFMADDRGFLYSLRNVDLKGNIEKTVCYETSKEESENGDITKL